MKFKFDVISFFIGTILGSGFIWKLLQYRIDRSKLLLKQAETSNVLRNQLFDLMISLKNKREFYADIRDRKVEVEGIRQNVLIQLQTEIDLIYDDILFKEKQLSIIENRKPREISKSHGGRPAAYSERSRTRFRLIANSVPIHPEQHSV